MKNFKLWSLTMLAVLALPLMVACGDDDDTGGNNRSQGGEATTINGKRLMKMIEGNDTISYEYNSEGKIVMELFGNDGKNKMMYSYNESQITMTPYYSSSTSLSSYVYSLTNGRITKAIYNSNSSSSSSNQVLYNYEYNNDGYLTAIRYSSSRSNPATYEHGTSYEYNTTENTTFTWKDGNMVKSTNEYVSTTITKSYTSSWNSTTYQTEWTPKTETSTSKSTTVKDYTYSDHNNVLPMFSSGDNSTLGWQGYFGRSSRNMPLKVEVTSTSSSNNSSSSSDTKIITYDYTFTDGVVTKLIETITGKSANVYSINFTWE